MVSLVKTINTTRAVLDNLEYGGKPRPYLGMSGIGHHCVKALWYGFHWVTIKKHDGRKERIFNAGHMFEPQIIKQLKDAGMEVFRSYENTDENKAMNPGWKLNEENGQIEVEHFGNPDEDQEEFIGFAGHSKGHSDGRIRGVIEEPDKDHLFETKTMKDSKFKEVCKKGVKLATPVYYSQMQRYMRATGLTCALFIAINKNNCSLYVERVLYKEVEAQDLVRKENLVIMADIVPHVDYDKTYYKCSYCDHRPVCHGEEEPAINCRTCDYCDIEDNGGWSCRRKDNELLTVAEQRIGCKYYKKGWDL